MAKPNFDKMWAGFPTRTDYPNLESLFTHLGGAAARNINVPGFGPNGNTCAARISVALKAGGVRITGSNGINTISTADGARIIYRVSEMRTYLETLLGAPERDNSLPFDSDFGTRKGIIAFSVEGWSDATGHIALYNGTSYREPSDNYANLVATRQGDPRTVRGEFWVL